MQNLGSLTRDQTLPCSGSMKSSTIREVLQQAIWLGLHIFGDIWGWETKGGYWERSKNTTMLKDPLLYLKVKRLKNRCTGTSLCIFMAVSSLTLKLDHHIFMLHIFLHTTQENLESEAKRERMYCLLLRFSSLYLPVSSLLGWCTCPDSGICLNDNSEAQ